MRKLLFVFVMFVAASAFAAPVLSGSTTFQLDNTGYSTSATLAATFKSDSLIVLGTTLSLDSAGAFDPALTISYPPAFITVTVDSDWSVACAPSYKWFSGSVTINGFDTITSIPVNLGANIAFGGLAIAFDADANALDFSPSFALAPSFTLGILKAYATASYSNAFAINAGLKVTPIAGWVLDLNYNPITEGAYANITVSF